jgi:peptidoglycan/xylan/chitin deacetylase (PgdA/CDA1 family)
MTQSLTIVMYHFVRELPFTRHPNIKGLLASHFSQQVAYLQNYYEFVTVADLNSALRGETNFPDNACLLTFDDGYIDHYTTVFPILEEAGIQGCFFPPAKPVLSNSVLNVNKIHFMLEAATEKMEALVTDVKNSMDKYRSEFKLKSNDYYYSKLAIPDGIDSCKIIFIKRLLQVELNEEVRNLICNELFHKYVTTDEIAFAKEIYMDVNQLKCMSRNGMYIGSHGNNHNRLDALSPEQQESEIDESLKFLKLINAPTEDWVMCYPYGAYNRSLIGILKKKGCTLGLTTKVDIANLSQDNAYTLERLDTNDLPCATNAEPNLWTQKIL